MLLALEGVACLRGGRLLFERLDLRLGPGDAALLTGPNGAGKSSLIRLTAGLLRAAAGRVEAAPLALADDRLALDERVTLSEALGFWARLDGPGGAGAQAGILAMGLEPLAGAPVSILSTGQRRRAVLARVIASGAPLWLLDEPANGLDSEGEARLAAAMAAHRQRGGAVLAASHQPLGLGDAIQLRLERR
jgi:heme exporter protein A